MVCRYSIVWAQFPDSSNADAFRRQSSRVVAAIELDCMLATGRSHSSRRVPITRPTSALEIRNDSHCPIVVRFVHGLILPSTAKPTASTILRVGMRHSKLSRHEQRGTREAA